MTVVQNVEVLPDGTTPVANVLVSIETSANAATVSGTATVVRTQSIRSDSSGAWSIDLIPNAQLLPAGVQYKITRRYPRVYGGYVHVDYAIVPPSGGPYTLAQVSPGDPDATPLTSDELANLLEMGNPFPQYLREDVADERYVLVGEESEDSGPIDHTDITDWDSALDSAISERSLSDLATPTGNLPMGSHKITGLIPGTASTDAATVGQLTEVGGGSGSSVNVVSRSTNYTATAGDYVIMDSSSAARVVSLPTPADGDSPIYVEQSGANAVSVSGSIKGSGTTLAIGMNGGVLGFLPTASTWRPIYSYYPSGVFARLDQDNDFSGHVLTGYADDGSGYSSATATVGVNIPWGSARQLTNSSGCNVTVPNTAPRVGAWVVLGQGSATQSTIHVASGGYIVATGARSSPLTTYDQNSLIVLRCIDATAGASGYIASGGMV